VPVSVMPRYPWFFDQDGYPNKKGMAIITYVQWLGSWLQEYPYWQGEGPKELEADEPQGRSPAPAAQVSRTGQPGASGVRIAQGDEPGEAP